MVNVFEVADLLVKHAVEKHGPDVDLIAYYGSQARGDAGPDSDLDLFYTPAEGRHPPIGRTFLLGGLLFDFWELRWETLEGFATGEIRGWAFAPALVRQATPLYARTSQQADRLAKLQSRSRGLENAEYRSSMQERAQDSFRRVVECLGSLYLAAQGSRACVSFAGWQLISSVWECLALANQVTFDRGLHGALLETERLQSRPPNLVELVSTISTSAAIDRVLEAAGELVAGTYGALQDRELTRSAKRSIREAFGEVYPEMKDTVRKLLAACEAGDQVAANLEAYSLQSDVTSILCKTEKRPTRSQFATYEEQAGAYRKAQLPDLMALSAAPLDELADATRRFDAQLRSFLREHGVDLCELASVEDLRDALQ